MKILFRYPSEKTAFSEVLSVSLLFEYVLITTVCISKSASLLVLVIVFENELF